MTGSEFEYKSLKNLYQNFLHPTLSLIINGIEVAKDKHHFAVSDIEVEITSGFEAAAAEFWIYRCYNKEESRFEFEQVKKYIFMGSSVVIGMGYGGTTREIFRGFISQVNFSFFEGEMPGIKVTAMDVKGIMMSGSYAKQLTAKSYSEAVKEILSKTAYERLKSNEIITKLDISNTPDVTPPGADGDSSQTIEMVGESDYEFVVKAAKKFNYEFFTIGGTVYFRNAKENTKTLMQIGPSTAMRSFDAEYSITGLMGKVEVRGMDAGKAKLISAVQKMGNKISRGNKAKPLVSSTAKVYIDPTVNSKQDAEYRAKFLAEDISYRLASLEAELVGIPELIPGRFISLDGISSEVSDTFYLVKVRHIMDGANGYTTRITGKSASMENMLNGII